MKARTHRRDEIVLNMSPRKNHGMHPSCEMTQPGVYRNIADKWGGQKNNHTNGLDEKFHLKMKLALLPLQNLVASLLHMIIVMEESFSRWGRKHG